MTNMDLNHKHNGNDFLKINKTDLIGTMEDGDDAVKKSGAETIAGVKTFTSSPAIPETPANDTDMASKGYVDTKEEEQPDSTIIAGDIVQDTANATDTTTSTSYFKKKEITFNEINGTIRVKFQLQSLNGDEWAVAKIYKNDVAVGTERQTKQYGADPDLDWDEFTEDISVSTNDKIQIYLKRVDDGLSDTARLKNMRLCYEHELSITAATVNLD